MTKELIELITYACRNNLWAKEVDVEKAAEEGLHEYYKFLESPEGKPFKNLSSCSDNCCDIVKKFDTPEECEKYRESIDDAFKIYITYSVKTGAGGMTASQCKLFGRSIQWGSLFFIEVDRLCLLHLMSSCWVWNGGQQGIKSGDFIDYMNRNGGKHWDELLEKPKEVIKDGEA